MPPADAFEKLVAYADEFGAPDGRPYFSIDGKNSLTKQEWEKQRAKFYCPIGVTNVWRQAPLNGSERLKNGMKALHLNQKPLKLTRMIIEMSSDAGDLVWEPFAGLCTGAIAAHQLKRKYVGAEINEDVYREAIKRVQAHLAQPTLEL